MRVPLSGRKAIYVPASTIVHTKSLANYHAVIKNYQYWSIIRSPKRSHAFVIRGLREDQTLEAINPDLSNNTKVKVIKVFKVKATASLFIIVTDDTPFRCVRGARPGSTLQITEPGP